MASQDGFDTEGTGGWNPDIGMLAQILGGSASNPYGIPGYSGQTWQQYVNGQANNGSGGAQWDSANVANGIDPGFQQWLAQNGYTLSGGINGNNLNAYLKNAGGDILAQGGIQTNAASDLRNIGALVAGGYFGGSALAGAAGSAGGTAALGGTGAATGAGLSSADLAAIYGPEGYGAGLTGAETGAVGGSAAAGGAASGATGGAATGGVTGATGASGSPVVGTGAWNGTNFTGSAGMDWGSLVAPALGVAGNVLQYDASKNAANQLSDAARSAAQTQMDMYNKSVQLNEPWRQAGIGALGQMVGGTQPGGDFNRSFSMADFQADPGYAFRLQQGQNALEASAAARGGLLSGGTGKALVDYGQQAGSQEYGNAYNRFNNDMSLRYNRLASLAGLGQTATGSDVNAGQQAAGQVGNYQTQIGNAGAAGTIGGANAINNGLSTIGNWWATQPRTTSPSYASWSSGTGGLGVPSQTWGGTAVDPWYGG